MKYFFALAALLSAPLAEPKGGDSIGGKLKVEPVWPCKNADDLRRIDTYRSFEDVGIMPAFPR
jgi:hypothetical protein